MTISNEFFYHKSWASFALLEPAISKLQDTYLKSAKVMANFQTQNSTEELKLTFLFDIQNPYRGLEDAGFGGQYNKLRRFYQSVMEYMHIKGAIGLSDLSVAITYVNPSSPDIENGCVLNTPKPIEGGIHLVESNLK